MKYDEMQMDEHNPLCILFLQKASSPNPAIYFCIIKIDE
jgi:hypothetical protein